jgi:hypothetical protein
VKDQSVANLKSMTDSFGDPVKLRNLIDAVMSDDSATGLTQTEYNGLTEPEKSLLKDEDCATGAKRLDNLLRTHFKGDPKKLADPFYKSLEGSNAKKLIRAASTFEVKPAESKVPNLKPVVCKEEDAKHFEERHCRAHVTMKPPALAPSTTPIGDKQYKPATLWPEGCTATDIKRLVEQIKPKVQMPPAGWDKGKEETKTFTSKGKNPQTTVTKTVFYTQNVSVDYAFKKAGKSFTMQIEIRAGVLQTTKTVGTNVTSTLEMTQFYPRSGSGLDTIGFDDMHKIKTALGK